MQLLSSWGLHTHPLVIHGAQHMGCPAFTRFSSPEIIVDLHPILAALSVLLVEEIKHS